MAFDRATTGNTTGVTSVIKASDPLDKKLVLINRSMVKKIKQHAYVKGISDSLIIRKALAAYFK